MGSKKIPLSKNSSQRERFIEAARKAGASEDEREFDRALKRVAKQKPKDEKKP
jgi:uncharacterized protein HemY